MKKDQVIAFRAPRALKAALEEYVKINMHMSPADVMRESLRDKIKTEAPELYARFFGKEAIKVEQTRKRPSQ